LNAPRRNTIGRLGRSTTVLLGVISLLAACTGQGGGGSTATAPAGTQVAPSTGTATAGPSAAGAVTLAIANDAELDDYVAGANGMALYVFLPDKGKDTSACTDECATKWPPLTGEVAAGAGVTGDLGTITRDDGTTQVTLGGAPLYYFMGDKAAGDVNGQGLNDVWYLASAEGTAVGDDDAPPAEQTPCGGRYCY